MTKTEKARTRGSGRLGRARGSGSLPGLRPLIVIPGGPGLGNGYFAGPLDDLLGETTPLVLYEPPLCAPHRSSTDAGSPFRDQVDALSAAITAQQVPTVDLIAHSFGGLVALSYLSGPGADRVARVVLVDSDPATFEEWSAFREVVAARRTVEQTRELARITGFPDWQESPHLLERYLQLILAPHFAKAERADRLHLGLDANGFRAFGATTRAVRTDLGEWDLRNALPAIRQPVLLLFGEKSVFPRRAMGTLHDGLPNSSLEILPGVGHFPFLEAPEAFQRVVAGFL